MHLFRIIFSMLSRWLQLSIQNERKKNGKQTNPKYQSLNFGKGKYIVKNKTNIRFGPRLQEYLMLQKRRN